MRKTSANKERQPPKKTQKRLPPKSDKKSKKVPTKQCLPPAEQPAPPQAPTTLGAESEVEREPEADSVEDPDKVFNDDEDEEEISDHVIWADETIRLAVHSMISEHPTENFL